jgi:hypothetical protein
LPSSLHSVHLLLFLPFYSQQSTTDLREIRSNDYAHSDTTNEDVVEVVYEEDEEHSPQTLAERRRRLVVGDHCAYLIGV